MSAKFFVGLVLSVFVCVIIVGWLFTQHGYEASETEKQHIIMIKESLPNVEVGDLFEIKNGTYALVDKKIDSVTTRLRDISGTGKQNINHNEFASQIVRIISVDDPDWCIMMKKIYTN